MWREGVYHLMPWSRPAVEKAMLYRLLLERPNLLPLLDWLPGRASPEQIVALVEKRDGFRYVDEIDWDEDGFWEVTYFTNDHARVEVRYDPVTGDPG